MLDASEYLHLAIHASNQENHHAALTYLNQALEQEPGNASVLYFLAAEHAELGLYDRACQSFEEALRYDPAMDTARFQLALLYLQLGKPEQAQPNFAYLQDGSADESIKAFAEAYLALLDEQLERAEEKLAAGLELCSNESLRNDMQRVLTVLQEGKNAEEGQGPVADEPVSKVFLGAYRDDFEPGA